MSNIFIFDDNPLRFATDPRWADEVLANFDSFLQDHAAAEKKASGMALSMISHYPDRKALVEKMTALAIEELQHFREVVKWLHKRKQTLAADQKDQYVIGLRNEIRQGKSYYFLDRLLTAAAIEARGCERFSLVAHALPTGELADFYHAIARSEARHYHLFYELALNYFDEREVTIRFDELLDAEAHIASAMPINPALH